MSKKAISKLAWFIPLAPLTLAAVIYFGELQITSFLFINHFTQLLPDTLWAWLTFLGNGWGVFALAFPLLLLAPRVFNAGIIAGAIAALTSTTLKTLFQLPRPASLLEDGSFYQIGEHLFNKAFPSGHTLTAFAIATAFYLSYPKGKRTHLVFLFIVASLVGLSRNAVGAHWLTDVLGGAGIGIWCGMLGSYAATYIPESQLKPQSTWNRFIAIGGLVSIYAHYTQTMDLELNLPLQYASIAIVAITLLFFIKAQTGNSKKKAE